MSTSDESEATVLHLATEADWANRTETHYEPAAYTAEGFVHCCTDEQLDGVVSRYFVGRSDLVLLTLDPVGLDAELVWEDTSGSGEAFPHVYGPISLSAVISAQSFDAGSGQPG